MESLLRLTEVESRTGLRRSAIYKRIELNEFPRPVRLTAKAVAWPASEISAWIQARITASRNHPQND
ncbi:MAG TPA: AlpA family transcriptional regulator [Candidatus Competibacteraceae bacterium]|nr:AlpA family transcriptional regulator [Candidatus Competibacteraceae bacterium]